MTSPEVVVVLTEGPGLGVRERLVLATAGETYNTTFL